MFSGVRPAFSSLSRYLYQTTAVANSVSSRHLRISGSASGTDGRMENQVHHDVDKNTFLLGVDGGNDHAELVYNWISDDVIDFHHTGVPDKLQGKGIAKILAKAGLDFAVQKNLKVILSCTYMAKYVADNPKPEYTKLLFKKCKQ